MKEELDDNRSLHLLELAEGHRWARLGWRIVRVVMGSLVERLVKERHGCALESGAQPACTFDEYLSACNNTRLLHPHKHDWYVLCTIPVYTKMTVLRR